MHEEMILEEEAIAEERATSAARLGAAILDQPIREVAKGRQVLCVTPTTSVRVAIERMNQLNSGCVLVEEGGRLSGIFTERDVLTKVVGKRMSLERTTVGAIMTRHPESLSPDDLTSFALNKMSVGGFRHIPLVDDAGHAVGVVSMRDIVDFMVDLFPTEVMNLPPSPGNIPRDREGA
jgi:CBS domain-containing protein